MQLSFPHAGKIVKNEARLGRKPLPPASLRCMEAWRLCQYCLEVAFYFADC